MRNAAVAVMLVACGGDVPPHPNVAPPPPATAADASAASASSAAAPTAGPVSWPGDGPLGDDASPHVVAFDDGTIVNASWSPDGRMLALVEPHSIIVFEGDAMRLHLPLGGSATDVRFEGSSLAVSDGATRSLFDLTTGTRKDDTAPTSAARDTPDDPDATRWFAVEGGGWVGIVERNTSSHSVVQEQAWFHDDTGAHRYMAPFDVVRTTMRYSATRIGADGKRVTRPVFSVSCTSSEQQAGSVQHAGDLRRNLGDATLGTDTPSGGGGGCEGLVESYASPDGRAAAMLHLTEDGRQVLTIVSLATGRRADLALPKDATTTVVSFAPGAGRVLWQSREGTVTRTRLLDLGASPARSTWNVTSLPAAPERGAPSFSPDASRVALVTGDAVDLVQVSTGSIVSTLRAHPAARLTAVAARPGSLLLGTDAGVVDVVATRTVTRASAFAKDPVGVLAWSPSGRIFAAAAADYGHPPSDGRIALFGASGSAGRALASPARETSDVAFSPDDAVIAATSDKDVLTWSVADGSGPARISTSYASSSASVAIGARLVAVAESKHVALVARDTQAPAGTIDAPDGPVACVRFSTDGGTLYVLTATTIAAFDAASRTEKWRASLGEEARDARRLEVGSDALLVTGYSMRTQLRRAADGGLVMAITRTDGDPHAAFAGDRIVVAAGDIVRVLARDGSVLARMRLSGDAGAAAIEAGGRTEILGTIPSWCEAKGVVLPDSACDAVRGTGLLGRSLGESPAP